VRTTSRWAPGELEIEDSGKPATAFAGFASLEPAQVVLTHPLEGFYFRRDNRLGSYRIWHDRMQTTEARVVRARYPLLADLGLVPLGDTRNVHSVLVQREIPFTVYLPPVALPD
jgi:hypothetical protein